MYLQASLSMTTFAMSTTDTTTTNSLEHVKTEGTVTSLRMSLGLV